MKNRILALGLILAGLAATGCQSDSYYSRLGPFDSETEQRYAANRAACMGPGCKVCPTPCAPAPTPAVQESPVTQHPVVTEVQPSQPTTPEPCRYGHFWDCPSNSWVVLRLPDNREVGRIPANGPMMDPTEFTTALHEITGRDCKEGNTSSGPIAAPTSWIRP